ncbi:MAG: adenosylhomocysteinase [bacterium]|nr:adenosylhomocysteinase [bacterium]
MKYDVKNMDLAEQGKLKIEWAEKQMDVLRNIREDFSNKKPLKGTKLAACLHVTAETANLMITLKAGGAEVALTASNPLSTQDDVAASLVKHHEIPVFAVKGEDNKTYYSHIHSALEIKPDITMDDGADLVSMIHSQKQDLLKNILGGTEETTTGVIRLKAMAKDKALKYPIIAVNNAMTKHFFDNRYGTGQSTIDGILRSTNILLAGKNVVVCGYGWCGKGVAMRSHGMGANVIITEVDSIRALEAVMDGYRVMPMAEAARIGDVFITVTGDKTVISLEHIQAMKPGAILCNSGHFNVEIDTDGLKKKAKSSRQIRDFVVEYTLDKGHFIYLLGEGRLINLAAAEGHPAIVMDMSFANQALAALHIKNNHKEMEKIVYDVPEKIDREIALLKLKSMGIHIDTLTEEQSNYLNSWKEGT